MIVENSNKKGLIINRQQKIIITSFDEESVVYTSDDNEIWYGELEDFELEYEGYEMIEDENFL